jgi:hypothetical protein
LAETIMTDPILRTDIENLPTDGRRVIVGTMAGEVLFSHFIPPNKFHPGGRWANLASTEWPVAWLPMPEHPYFPKG